MHDPLSPVWAMYRVDDQVRKPLAVAVHDSAAFIYQCSGSAVFELRERLTLEPGDVVLIAAGEPHRLVFADQRAMWGVGFCASCYAPTELAGLLDPFEQARAGASPVVQIPEMRRPFFQRVCEALAQESEQTAARHAPIVLKSLLALLLVEISRGAEAFGPPEALPSVVADALRYIEHHCLGPLSLSAVAEAVSRSPSHLTTVVKQATGKTVGEWISTGRLAEARRRLLHSDEVVEVIAERVGYEDTTHFIRVFRRMHGMTPAAWRRARRHRAPHEEPSTG